MASYKTKVDCPLPDTRVILPHPYPLPAGAVPSSPDAVEASSSMDKVRKLLSSPSAKRKASSGNLSSSKQNGSEAVSTATSHHVTPSTNGSSPAHYAEASGGFRPSNGGYFGILLEEICQRENRDIPNIVTRVCTFIYNHGLHHEGLFRINGNSRLIDNLRLSFDGVGDADLEGTEDVMSVACLLKLFLRELPCSLVPEGATAQFVSVQEELGRQMSECLRQLRHLLSQLPPTHYHTLKYLVRFLVLVAKNENFNKMSPMSLGIVFGPNIFRCSAGIQGLREQGITNQIMVHFIKEYDALFLADGETSPYAKNFVPDLKKGRIAPPRPPPPKVDSFPVPSPRKVKTKYEHTAYQDKEEDIRGQETPRNTPRFNEDEFIDPNRAPSPFTLDTDRSEKGTEHPLEPLNSELVEKAITSAVSQHLFGDSTNSMSSDDSVSKDSSSQKSPVMPAARKKRKERDEICPDSSPSSTSSPTSSDESNETDGNMMTIKERIQKFEIDDETADLREGKHKPQRQRPKSDAFELFEAKGLVITPAPNALSKTHKGLPTEEDSDEGEEVPMGSASSDRPSRRPVPQPRSPRKRHASPDRPFSPVEVDRGQSAHDSDDSGFGTIQRQQNTLSTFKRAPGPKNRRHPSRKKSPEMTIGNLEPDLNGINEHISVETGNKAQDFNHNETRKPSISFLDLHPVTADPGLRGGVEDRNGSSQCNGDKSASRKPYIPPLDLSILHEHGDGSEPIPAGQGMSLSLQKAKSMEDASGMLSPRNSKHKCKPNETANTDVPPSPPSEQVHFFSMSNKCEDDHASSIKQLTKKIQSCKRKIKVFEEAFEMEHGYRPSQTDKAAKPEIKRCVQELAKARKELRQKSLSSLTPPKVCRGDQVPQHVDLEPDFVSSYGRDVAIHFINQCFGVKEEAERLSLGVVPTTTDLTETPPSFGNSTNHTPQNGSSGGKLGGEGGPLPSGVILGPGATQAQMLEALLCRLKEKRVENGRPEELSAMNREQVYLEKIAVQKALLHFEGVFGRPKTKSEKELMRPLYDRYRAIKRLLSKPLSPKEKTELQAVPEDSPIEFSPASKTDMEVKMEENDDFMVTRDLRLLQTASQANHADSHDTLETLPKFAEPRQAAWMYSDDPIDQENIDLSPGKPPAWNLHELTVPELLEEQQNARIQKKNLRKILRDFEDQFFQQTGRKVLKEERTPMEAEYQEYKQIKAKIKLLDALLSKHDPIGASIP